MNHPFTSVKPPHIVDIYAIITQENAFVYCFFIFSFRKTKENACLGYTSGSEVRTMQNNNQNKNQQSGQNRKEMDAKNRMNNKTENKKQTSTENKKQNNQY